VPGPRYNASAGVETQLRVTGLDGPNKLVVSQVPGQNVFLVTDTAPINALPGCAVVSVPDGLFGVECRAIVTTSGALKSYSVNAGAGDDVVVNKAPAAMKADGGPGADVLNGGEHGDILRDSSGNDTLRGNGGDDDINTQSNAAGGGFDTLEGGAGGDIMYAGPGQDILLGGDGKDRLVGGLGPDNLDPGAGLGDVVAYEQRTDRHVISLDGVDNDGHAPLQGPADEGDNVQPSTEIVQGSAGNDTMFGNENPNIFEGFGGNDVLEGGLGADDLRGGLGDDNLASNKFFGVPVADGAIDKLDGFVGTDYCRVPFVNVEADITISCENINQD
jgi:Ca2+-binding RTX toxin-like protein